MIFRFAPVAPLALALAACADTSQPDPTPAEDGSYDMIEPVANPVAGEPLPPKGGEWSRGSVEGREAAIFTPLAGDPILALFCDERDGIVVERRGLLPAGPYEMMDIALGNVRESFAVNQVENDGPVLRAKIPFNSEFYNRLRELEGTMSIEAGQAEPIVVPGDPLLAELVRTCTTGASAVPALDEAQRD